MISTAFAKKILLIEDDVKTARAVCAAISDVEVSRHDTSSKTLSLPLFAGYDLF
jgi:hypothetical protein